ncbi:MAG: VCBS repeat-containing protein [Planctomycetes bacterium]|nr:VCBS repeat-containing protein [Planctomycetota bacterium]
MPILPRAAVVVFAILPGLPAGEGVRAQEHRPHRRVPVSVVGDAGDAASAVTRESLRAVWGLPAGGAGTDGPTLELGWPVAFPANPVHDIDPFHGVALVDLDLDGRLEIVRPSTDGQLYVLRYDGNPLSGWPRPLVGFGQEAAATGDLDGDGRPEIVVGTRGVTTGGAVHAFRGDGRPVPGWPVSLGGNNIGGSPVLADLDRDGLPEVIVQERASPRGRLHVLRGDGTPLGAGFPYVLDHVPAGTPAVGDLDGDGWPELVTISYRSLHALRLDGTPLPGFPIDVTTVYRASFSYQSPVLADLDRDGRLDIVVACHGSGSGCYAFGADGQLQAGWPLSFGGNWTFSPPTVADVDGDGRLEVVVGRAGTAFGGPALYVLDRQARPLPGFPIAGPGGSEGPLAVGDLDLDGVNEIVFDSNIVDANGDGYLHCVDARGNAEPGWPLRVPGYSHLNGAQLGDVDGDGRLELVAVSRRAGVAYVSVFEPAPTPRLQSAAWRTYHDGDGRRGLAGDSYRFGVTGRATPAGRLHFEVRGEIGSHYAILSAGAPALLAVPGIRGYLRLDPVTTTTLKSGFLDWTGRAEHGWRLPPDASVVGTSLYLQAVTSGSAGAELSELRALAIR